MLYIKLRQYEYVLAVAETGSLTAAAERLNVSQPSLSVAITRVEEQLGEQLFLRRKGSAVRLTPFGHRFIKSARALLKHATALETSSQSQTPFTLACFRDIAPWYLAPALARLRASNPGQSFQGREGRFAHLNADLTEGRADIALSYDIGFPESFGRETLTTVSPVAFLHKAHPLAGAASLELQDLTDDPLILFDEDLSEGFVRDVLRHLQLDVQIGQRVHSLEMMRSFAAHGAGIGVSYSCPPGTISYDGRELAQIPISTPEARADIKLIWSDLRPRDKLFEDALKILRSGT